MCIIRKGKCFKKKVLSESIVFLEIVDVDNSIK